MGTKTLKWEIGQKMLVKAVMDRELYDMIDENIYVAGFTDTDVITDRNGVTVRACHSYKAASPVHLYACYLFLKCVLGRESSRRNCIHGWAMTSLSVCISFRCTCH